MLITVNISKSQKLFDKQSAFLTFDYNNEIISIVRELPDRYWHATDKQWEVPVKSIRKLANKLTNHTFKINVSVDCTKSQHSTKTSIPKNFKFKTEPYQHQIEGVEFALSHQSFLLGDEQGLGKTKQVIDIAVLNKQKHGYKHCLIVCCVNGLKWNWHKEVSIHSNETAWILGSRFKNGKHIIGTMQDRLDDLYNLQSQIKDYFIITNVETLRDEKIVKKLKELCDKGVIQMIAADEIHKCKNPNSQQSKGLLKLNAPTVIPMSGTPLLEKPLDLYVPLRWIGVETHNFTQFKRHYCVLGGYGGYEIVSYKNLSDLHEQVSSNMLRRRKMDVLDLPDKIYTTEFVEMNKQQQKIYKEVQNDLLQNIDKVKGSSNPLTELIRLRQATGYTGILSSTVQESAKLDRMEELVEDIVANGQKCIICSNWTKITDIAIKRLQNYNPAVITGQVKDTRRKVEEQKFMTDNSCKVIVGTIDAMGTGLTLTAATTVIFLDEPWNRGIKEQAEDRAHRIGTKSNVNIITLICKDTIDERINELVYKKGAMADILVDGKINNNSVTKHIDFLLS